MEDINFDELDKAVNSVLQQSPAEPKKAEAAVINSSLTQTIPTVPSTIGLMTDDTSQVSSRQPVSTSSVPERPQAVVMPKRRGQFMDLVHPSSDMTNRQVASGAPATTSISRQSTTLQPLDRSVVEASSTPSSPAGDEQDQAVLVPSVSDEDVASQKSEWPDPLDMVDPNEGTAASDMLGDVQRANSASIVQAEGGFVSNEDEGPLDSDVSSEGETAESPFIQGHEVEKRPLGAFAETTDQKTSSSLGTVDASLDYEEHAMTVEQETAVQEVPDELTPEVVSVESDERNDVSGGNEQYEEEQSAVLEGMATSISPQYQPTESQEVDEASHPVFDTSEYHRPLTPPAKKSHTGLIVLLTILIAGALVFGAWYAIFVLKVL